MVDPTPVIVGASGSSGKGWSELKDIECLRRYSYIKQIEAAKDPSAPRVETQYDEAFQTGIFMHAARAKWLCLGQSADIAILTQCNQAGRDDCAGQGMPLPELSFLEYSLMFIAYANYWAIRPKLKPYAVELFLDHNFGDMDDLSGAYVRSTRYDDLCWYPDAGGYCIGEFKTTYDLSGALRYYDQNNPQILLQWLLYKRSKHVHPDIKGTMVDIWDKGKNRGTRHFVPLEERLLLRFEVWLRQTLHVRLSAMKGLNPRNYLVCNTYNDAYKSKCAFKERCMNDNA